MKTLRVLCALLLPLATCAPGAANGGPTVVDRQPPHRARDVDPATTELVATFSEPMAEGRWSWCGGGEHFPSPAGDIHFRDDVTAVYPVALQPQKTYFLSLNCPSARNFVSATGEPAEITPYCFTTAAAPGQLVTADPTNHESWKQLRELLLTRWSHFDRTGVDWAAAMDDAQEWLLGSPDAREFMLRASILLEDARDPHLKLEDPTGQVARPFRHSADFNGNWDATVALFNARRLTDVVWTGRAGDVGYLAVHSWGGDDTDTRIRLAMESMRELPALIVDVRGNGGGDETLAKQLAGWFLDEPRLYARHRFRDPDAPGGWTEMRERWVQPNEPGQRFPGRVFVLQGPVCLSSNEAFLMMMEQADRATSLGATSGGSSANPRRHTLANGVQVVLPRWQAFRSAGQPLEGVGVPPDIAIDPGPPGMDFVAREALRLANDSIKPPPAQP